MVYVTQSIDVSTLNNKVLLGYQGWFDTKNDGASMNWKHWSNDKYVTSPPSANNAAFDLFPDLTEYDQNELEDTGMIYNNGNKVKLYSAQHLSVVDLHFKWLRDYNLDGVFLQRFVGELTTTTTLNARNVVLKNVQQSAEKYGRSYCIMYDVSGANDATLIQTIQDDWWHLSHVINITDGPSYQHHNNKPVVAIWGLGFNNNPGNYSTSYNIVNWIQINGGYVVGGVPFNWRDSNGDSKPNFQGVYEKMDCVSPWSVGRYNSIDQYQSLLNSVQKPDVQLTSSRGQSYAPVIWPGFSWYNLNGGVFNEIPRQGGSFYNSQGSGSLSLDPDWLYVAMFDEVNESTAIFKAANSTSNIPDQGNFLYLGYNNEQDIPTDHYLQLTESITNKFHSRP